MLPLRSMTRFAFWAQSRKNIQVSRHFKVVGAEIDGSDTAVSRGIISVGAPAQKRLAMSNLSLRVAVLPVITKGFAAQLAGNWILIFLYRRCLTCLLAKIYGCSSNPAADDEVFELTRSAADELVLASVFSFLACTDLSIGFCNCIFATDASMAVVSRKVGPETAKAVWLSGNEHGTPGSEELPAVKRFRRDEAKTPLGNFIAFSCLFLAWVASLFDGPVILEQPQLLKMAWFGAISLR